jgi:hypothetical protein
MAIETDLEREVAEWALTEGGRALKLKIENERGFPDRTIILPYGVIAFPELKRTRGSTKKYEQQKRMVEWLKNMGFPSEFCRTLDEVKELCAK